MARYELTDVKGIGPSAARKLEQAGVSSVEELAHLDLRSRTVEGLSTEHLAHLRENAERFLEARRTGDLTLVEGVGPSAREKLQSAGIESVGELAELDLRKRRVEGLSTENLQRIKRNARYLVP